MHAEGACACCGRRQKANPLACKLHVVHDPALNKNKKEGKTKLEKPREGMKERTKENREPKGGMGGRHA